MSVDLIGNGNLPCVYTKNVEINETVLLLRDEIKVSCVVYDFINSNGDLMWTDKEFLNNEIYVYSLVLYDIQDVLNMQKILTNNY